MHPVVLQINKSKLTTIKTQLYKIMTQSATCFDHLGAIIRPIFKTY